MSELKQQLEMKLTDDPFTYEELKAVVGLLAGPGHVWQLEFGQFVLLHPERVNRCDIVELRKPSSVARPEGLRPAANMRPSGGRFEAQLQQIIFQGAPFTALNLQRMRDRVFSRSSS